MKILISRKQQGGKLKLPNDATKVNNKIEEKVFTKNIRQDLSDLSEAEFQIKYGTNKSDISKHKYKQDNYPEYADYAKRVGKENAATNGSIDYVDSDVRSKNFGGYSNMFFLTPNQQGTPLAKGLQEQTGDIITAALPLPNFKVLKKVLPSIKTEEIILPAINNTAELVSASVNPISIQELKSASIAPLRNAKNYFNSEEFKKRFIKFSEPGMGVKFPEVTSDIPIFTYNSENELKAISNHPIPQYTPTQKELDLRKASFGYAQEKGIFIKHPENTSEGISRFPQTLSHELYHWYSDFNTPLKGFKPMNEILPTEKVIGREKDFKSYEGIVPSKHSLRGLQESILPIKTTGDNGKEVIPVFSNAAEPSAYLYQLKQNSGVGKYGNDLTALETDKFYQRLQPYFKEGASKKDITDYLKLIPAATGAAYITNKTNEK